MFHSKNEQSAPTYQKEQVASVSSIKQLNEKDSDNDGLKDWEEALWQTDPNNPDTDNDGTKDGEEIKENRNPLVAGPDDKIIIEGNQTAPSDNEEKIITLTDAIGQTFIGELSVSKSNNGQVTRDEINALVESVFGVLQNYSEEINKYSIENLQTSTNNTSEAVKTYANELAKILKKEFDPIPEDEMDIFNAALSQDDPARLEELKTLSVAYKNVSKTALTLKVPEELQGGHLAVVNSFDLISENLVAMGLVLTDPAAGYLGLQNYAKNIQTAYKALSNINKYLTNNAIVFNNDEPANIFAVYTELERTP